MTDAIATLKALEQRLRERPPQVRWKPLFDNDDCLLMDEAADFIAAVIKLCNEHKWSVMVDESGSMEDAILVVDVLRAAEQKQEEAT